MTIDLASRGPRVLVLDSNPTRRDDVCATLRARACTVISAATLSEALTALAVSPPDVCVIHGGLADDAESTLSSVPVNQPDKSDGMSGASVLAGKDSDVIGALISHLPAGAARPRVIYCTSAAYSTQTVQSLHDLGLADVVLPAPVQTVELALHVMGLAMPAARPQLRGQAPCSDVSVLEAPATISAAVPLAVPLAVPSLPIPPALAALRSSYQQRMLVQLRQLSVHLRQLSETPDESLSSDALQAALALSHKLTGTAGSYGFVATSALSRRIENRLRAHDCGNPAQAPELHRAELLEHCQLLDRMIVDLTNASSDPQAPQAADNGRQGLTPTPEATSPPLLIVQAELSRHGALVRSAETLGLRVIVARTESEALALTNDLQPDTTIIDANLGPGDDAFRMIRRLRAAPGGVMMRIALVTSDDSATQRMMAARTPVELLCSGPLTVTLLPELIRRLEHRRPRPVRILVVDDDPDFTDRLSSALQVRGAETIVVSDPQTCLQAIDSHRPDLVMLDLMMPVVSGLELCRLIRSSARWCELPVVAITAWTEPQVRITAYQAGADDYLSKPLVEDELSGRVLRRAQRARREREERERDNLTDLLLRTPYVRQTQQLLSGARRHAMSLCVAMVDVDNFKEVNDSHGHLVGDQVLATCARLLAQGTRTEDICARWGGEEFTITLVGADELQAMEVLERLLASVQAFEFTGAKNQTFHISFSGGVACSQTTPGDVSALIAKADDALYRAKAAGRKRIMR